MSRPSIKRARDIVRKARLITDDTPQFALSKIDPTFELSIGVRDHELANKKFKKLQGTAKFTKGLQIQNEADRIATDPEFRKIQQRLMENKKQSELLKSTIITSSAVDKPTVTIANNRITPTLLSKPPPPPPVVRQPPKPKAPKDIKSFFTQRKTTTPPPPQPPRLEPARTALDPRMVKFLREHPPGLDDVKTIYDLPEVIEIDSDSEPLGSGRRPGRPRKRGRPRIHRRKIKKSFLNYF